MRQQRNKTHSSLQGVKLHEFNFQQFAPDALKGVWARKWDEYLQLTIVKGHAILTSSIVTEPTRVEMELPAHPAFWMTVLGPSGCRAVLVLKNDPISMPLQANEQIQATFTIGDENGL